MKCYLQLRWRIFFPLLEINEEADSINKLDDQKFKDSSKLSGILYAQQVMIIA